MNDILSIPLINSRLRSITKTRRTFIFYSLFIIHYSFFIPHSSVAQLNTWQPQVSYQSGRAVAVAGQTGFGASDNGLFAVDLVTNETTILDKTSGLGDVGVTRMLHLPDRRSLLVAYRSGLLELLLLSPTGQPRLDSILTISTLRDAPQLSGSRRVNQLLRVGADVYLATDYGIVVLNPARPDIRETYRNIGPGGSAVAVQSLAVVGDSLFALTANGLLAARFSPATNLGFFGNWRVSPGPDAQPPTDLLAVGNQLITAVPGRGIFSRPATGTGWTLIRPVTTGPAVRIFLAPGGYLTVTSGSVILPDGSRRSSPRLTDPRDAFLTDSGRLLVADGVAGLLDISANGTRQIGADGPASDLFAGLVTGGQTIIALPGGADASLSPLNRRAGFDALPLGGRWQIGTGRDLPGGLPANFGAAVFDPALGVFWLGSFGGGLWQLSVGLDAGGTLPAPVSVTLPGTIDQRISSLAIDANNNLWIATPAASDSRAALHVRLAATGAFQAYTIPRRDVLQIVIDDSGFLWLRLSPAVGGGLLVYDPNTNRSRQLFASTNEGNLPAQTVLSMVKDRTGAIWVGTTAGVTVFDNPGGVFGGNVNARPPIFGRRALLVEQAVTALAVDGGNRKWIGTGAGLYQFSADGTQLLANFTTANSPLPANDIRSIGIEQTGGQVFVATGNGLITYRAATTEPAENLTTVTIFPNPVRPDFSGTIGIRGLTDRAMVKILDAGGQLVFETRAEGGTATWDGRDYRGRTAQTGVYLVVVIGADGSQGIAGKLAIVR